MQEVKPLNTEVPTIDELKQAINVISRWMEYGPSRDECPEVGEGLMLAYDGKLDLDDDSRDGFIISSTSSNKLIAGVVMFIESRMKDRHEELYSQAIQVPLAFSVLPPGAASKVKEGTVTPEQYEERKAQAMDYIARNFTDAEEAEKWEKSIVRFFTGISDHLRPSALAMPWSHLQQMFKAMKASGVPL